MEKPCIPLPLLGCGAAAAVAGAYGKLPARRLMLQLLQPSPSWSLDNGRGRGQARGAEGRPPHRPPSGTHTGVCEPRALAGSPARHGARSP